MPSDSARHTWRGDAEFARPAYGQDVLLWNRPQKESSFGGAGLDILIANTGGDRLLDDDVTGVWGNDWHQL